MNKIKNIADAILRAEKVIVYSGAGISTESNIPDFRSPGGVWEKSDHVEFTHHKFLVSEESREKYWQFSKLMWPKIRDAESNSGHYALAELYQMGKLDCVITQNVDGLHQKAGIPEKKLIEVHGTVKWILCLNCGIRYPRKEIHIRLVSGVKVPRCDICGGLLKSATVSFGQQMPEIEMQQAEEKSAACDLFLVAGSSLVVYPAAMVQNWLSLI
ncbi:MAG: Sir2 family NAD-dependent protein deacetylase [Dehalococcoidales bacterium]|nr:Sir2 family NAD-dependent protein deacetylase [Dehalococcoidales bacterium]